VKKHIILVALVVLCLIPTVVAVSSYRKTQTAPVDDKTAVKLVINDTNGKTHTFLRENGGTDADMILFFVGLRERATKIAGLPDSLTGEQSFVVTISSNVKNESYQFYFSPDPTTNYYVSPTGQAYKLAEADAANFINTVYAESIYEAATMPVLTLSGEHVVTPDAAVWQYKNYTGNYVDSDTSSFISADVESYSLEGGFDLAFDQTPDYFTIKITDPFGSVLYDDIYSDLNSLFTFDSNTRLTVTVTAQWYEDPSRNFCGKLDYSFTSLVTAPAEFYLGMNSVRVGRFVAVTALNVLNPDKIQFSSEPSLGYTPTFYMEGDHAIALIPIAPTLAAGTYNLTFVYGGTTQHTNLTVTNVTFGQSNVSISTAVLNLYRTQTTLAAFERTVAEITASSESTRYFSGSFSEGIGGNKTLLRGYGREIILNNDKSNTYRNNGVDYQAPAGTNVVACNSGKVVYAGILDYTGYLIVIDHGMGLKTWYYNLGSVSVKVGDMVAKGDTIGTCGDTGFAAFSGTTKAHGAHIAMSVGNQFVCPYDTWADSEIAAKVIIWGVDE